MRVKVQCRSYGEEGGEIDIDIDMILFTLWKEGTMPRHQKSSQSETYNKEIILDIQQCTMCNS